ncbi:hypothetical protein UCREL1_9385 [Eutypa lata UCREL1]|uniref:Uncharacterized protein n=1 Tax=Eutypa lata (strain UCR-EL1) TaxID=1287681 RepID=M7SHQ3_EUTLA|nr:hypothetical protein UCREL1_9385 [Eutypa lata UCREL1]
MQQGCRPDVLSTLGHGSSPSASPEASSEAFNESSPEKLTPEAKRLEGTVQEIIKATTSKKKTRKTET